MFFVALAQYLIEAQLYTLTPVGFGDADGQIGPKLGDVFGGKLFLLASLQEQIIYRLFDGRVLPAGDFFVNELLNVGGQ